MKKHLIILAFISLCFYGCEREEIVDPETDFKEQTVVMAEIYANEIFRGVSVTRTLPPGIQLTASNAAAADAMLYLLIDSTRVIPLHHKSDGLYQPLYRLDVLPGQTYELFGVRGDETFYSRTTVPQPPSLVSAAYNITDGYCEAVVRAKPGEVYGAVWMVSSPVEAREESFFEVSAAGVSGETRVRTSALPPAYRSTAYRQYRHLRAYSFDPFFAAFHKTAGNGVLINNAYLQSAGKIEWNVRGTNVIGLFLGIAKTNLVPTQ